MIRTAWNLVPFEWKVGLSAAALLASLGVLGGVPVYFHHQWYTEGDNAGYARRKAEDDAAAQKQQAAIDQIRAETEQQMADVAAILRKAQQDDSLDISAVDQAAAADAGASDICLSADVVHHLRVVGGH